MRFKSKGSEMRSQFNKYTLLKKWYCFKSKMQVSSKDFLLYYIKFPTK